MIWISKRHVSLREYETAFIEVALSQEERQRMLNYIAALEEVNDQMLVSLKNSVQLLAQFKKVVPDPDGWQEMLDVFELSIGEKERLASEHFLH